MVLDNNIYGLQGNMYTHSKNSELGRTQHYSKAQKH